MIQKLISAALLNAIILPVAAYAETPLELVIVTPARMQQSQDRAIADTTVLDELDIRQSGAYDLPTLLRTLAGVEIYQSGGLGKQSSTFMRGTNSSHVVVLLDGVRINSATTGTTALEHIMLDSIERIEVVRGNVSSLYGSEAIGGVIQLFTKRGRAGAPVLNVSAGLGSYGTKRLAVGLSGVTDVTSFSVNIGKVKTEGVSAINTQIAPTANPDKDGYDNTTFNARIQHTINDDHHLSATLFKTRADSQYDNAFNLATTDRNKTRVGIEKLSLGLDNQFTEMWQSKLRWGRGTDDSKDFLNGAENSRIKTTNKQLVWQNELQLADTQHLNLAAERLEQSVASNTLYTLTTRSANSVLAGYIGEYGAQQVQFNLRQDRYSDFGAANTGLFGYGVSFSDSWRATLSISNAFKAPTFNDMYAPVAWGGNPDLQPERANNREIGLRYMSDGQRIDVIYFDNRIQDLIAYQFPLVMNVKRARIDGVELSYVGEFGDTYVKANMTMQNPRDISTGQLLLRRAKLFANLSISQQLGALKIGGEWQYSDKRADIDINTFARTILAAYDVMNLTANYTLTKRIDLLARVDNLFNQNYVLAHGYNTLGRALFIGLNYKP